MYLVSTRIELPISNIVFLHIFLISKLKLKSTLLKFYNIALKNYKVLTIFVS